MDFREMRRAVDGSREVLTLFNVDAPSRVVDQVVRHFEPQQIRLRRGETDNGQLKNFAVLHDDGAYVAASTFRTIVETHVYGLPDWEVPPELGVRSHGIDADEIAESWFVVYDGGGNDTALCPDETATFEFYAAEGDETFLIQEATVGG
ncbi:hypothetical protein BRC83_08265 [Halobacteriales archaeon QS_1_68_17]|nr:MAG: hypothetical protein BRC83_08265 [Halobacteriales archaeon QS_1_68_17]